VSALAQEDEVKVRAGLGVMGAAILVIGALGGCSGQPAQSPAWTSCGASVDGVDKLQAKVLACANLIEHGASGDQLEQALAQRGEAERRLSNLDLAIADFSRALRLRPGDLIALNGRGVAYLDEGKPDPALVDFNAAILANPGDGAAFGNRASVERARGDYSAAIFDRSRAIELAPDDASAWAARGYDYAGKRQWDSAIADFDDALRRAPNDASALEGRAEAERGKGDAKAAIRDYQAALNDPRTDNALADADAVVELSPAGDPEALNTRCWVRGVNDVELPAALADCQQSLATRPNSAETLDSLAMIYFRQGRYDVAITEYTAALAADPNQQPSRYMRGIAKLRSGDAVGGQADIAAANAADSSVAGTFAGYGLKP
jgi:tetratricopeptide (TPR) repeat protein